MNRSAHHVVTQAGEHLAGGLEHTGKAVASGSAAAGSAAEAAAGSAADAVRAAAEAVDGVVNRTGESLRSAVDYTSTRTKQVTRGIEKSVAAHPLKAVAIAAGVGFTAALVWRGWRR